MTTFRIFGIRRYLKRTVYADAILIILGLTLAYGLLWFYELASSDYSKTLPVKLDLMAIPGYTLLSLVRSLIALGISFSFAILYGTIAARKPLYERTMIPVLDVLQSLPLLSFLPVFVNNIVPLFPDSRWGIEISCILNIFIGQVWGLIFAYYESQKTLPKPLKDIAVVTHMSPLRRFFTLDLPNGIRPLVYNGMMAMAGGWFFLTMCESFTMENERYLLPGLGSFLSIASESGEYSYFAAGLVFLMVLIIGVDIVFWKPFIAWTAEFRETIGIRRERSEFLELVKSSSLPDLIELFAEKIFHPALKILDAILLVISGFIKDAFKSTAPQDKKYSLRLRPKNYYTVTPFYKNQFFQWVTSFAAGACVFYIFTHLSDLNSIIRDMQAMNWNDIIFAVVQSLMRVFTVLFLASLWCVPLGLWIGQNPSISKIAQPLIQNLAAFPAPVIFPILTGAMIWLGAPNNLTVILLMLVGNQFYLLFNVISGANRVSQELKEVSSLYRLNPKARLLKLYIPSLLPSLATGWITMAGGAWNTTIAAEVVATATGHHLSVPGVGSLLKFATESGDASVRWATITATVIVLVIVNRTVWKSLNHMVERVQA